jgi:hypothetical protein
MNPAVWVSASLVLLLVLLSCLLCLIAVPAHASHALATAGLPS